MRRLSTFEFDALRVHRLVAGPLQENAYLVAGADGGGFLVDPGDDAGDILELLGRAGARPAAVLLTHAHFDHVGAVAAVRAALGVPVYLHPDARGQLDAAPLAAERWGFAIEPPGPPNRDLIPGPLEIGGLALAVLHTPGHAPGHVSLRLPGFVFAGDALFRGSIGRTDLPGGNHETLLQSIRQELLSLPPETVVLPGHGPESTVGLEARTNPFLV